MSTDKNFQTIVCGLLIVIVLAVTFIVGLARSRENRTQYTSELYEVISDTKIDTLEIKTLPQTELNIYKNSVGKITYVWQDSHGVICPIYIDDHKFMGIENVTGIKKITQ